MFSLCLCKSKFLITLLMQNAVAHQNKACNPVVSEFTVGSILN